MVCPGRNDPAGILAAVPYEVRTPVFEGPFDLLLHLILREQVEIHDVSLSRVVDAYVAELERLPSLDLEVATEFLLIAATLIELKSRRLLPDVGDLEPDEELGVWEQRDLLVARLLECRTFRAAAAVLQRLADEAGRSFPRTAAVEERFASLGADLLAGVTPTRLRDALLRACAPRSVARVDLDHVAPIRASVVEAVDELVEELPRLGRTTFRQLTSGMDRIGVIVRFLALLELFKQALISLDQATTFGSIEVTWTGGERTEDVRPLVEAHAR